MKLCVIQEPPVYLDLTRSMEWAIELIARAAAQGAGLVVFPEAWFPGYPTFVWRLAPGAEMGPTDELFARLQDNAIDRLGGGLAPLQEAAAEHGVVLVLGYHELDSGFSGSTLFNSCAVIDSDGRIANNHRKLFVRALDVALALQQAGPKEWQPAPGGASNRTLRTSHF